VRGTAVVPSSPKDFPMTFNAILQFLRIMIQFADLIISIVEMIHR
jgi:hypothetical protein